jgi:hypothetical protein
MNTAQVSREAAERWHRFNLAYPELAERALHETIEGVIEKSVSELKAAATELSDAITARLSTELESKNVLRLFKAQRRFDSALQSL